jgi:lambda repressor-like predicted transcriptional regulator
MNGETKKLPALIIDTLHAKGMSVERLSQLSGVSENFLASLIEGDLMKLPPRPYTHGYLLKIAEVLNLDGEKIWNDYLKDNDSIKRSGKHDRLPQNRFAIKDLERKTIVLGSIGIIIIIFIAGRVPAFFGEPKLILHDLKDEPEVKYDRIYTIRGEADPNAHLTLNGERLIFDNGGRFEKTITLEPGFNTITFTIKKLLGKEYVIKRQIFYQTSEINTESSGGNQIQNDTQ